MEKKSRMQELIDDVKALRKCVEFVWKKRNTYILYAIVGAILSLVVSFSIPKTYRSSVLLAPETTESEFGSGMTSVAGLAGIDLGMSQDAYTVDLYPKIVSSVDFSLSLSEIKVKSSKMDTETTYYNYLLKHDKYPWWNYPIFWMKSTISKMFAEDVQGGGSESKMRYISKQENAVCGKIQNKVHFSIEKQVGVISVVVYDHDPEIASIVADSVVERLNNFILDYRTAKARKHYEYASALCDSTRLDYLSAQDKYVKYVSTHNSLNSPVQIAEKEFLEKEVELAYQSYNTATLQKQMAQAKIYESTPVYTIIESAYVPLFADSPKKVFLMAVFIILSCVVATIKILYSEIFKDK